MTGPRGHYNFRNMSQYIRQGKSYAGGFPREREEHFPAYTMHQPCDVPWCLGLTAVALAFLSFLWNTEQTEYQRCNSNCYDEYAELNSRDRVILSATDSEVSHHQFIRQIRSYKTSVSAHFRSIVILAHPHSDRLPTLINNPSNYWKAHPRLLVLPASSSL